LSLCVSREAFVFLLAGVRTTGGLSLLPTDNWGLNLGVRFTQRTNKFLTAV
jgi:hypothetical protein